MIGCAHSYVVIFVNEWVSEWKRKKLCEHKPAPPDEIATIKIVAILLNERLSADRYMPCHKTNYALGHILRMDPRRFTP
jgi:hypothetical protein